MILFEAFMSAVCVVLMPSDKAKLIASTTVTACFTLIACYTRPYVEDVEDYTDICSRVFMLVTLGVGIALYVDRDGQAACRGLSVTVMRFSSGGVRRELAQDVQPGRPPRASDGSSGSFLIRFSGPSAPGGSCALFPLLPLAPIVGLIESWCF